MYLFGDVPIFTFNTERCTYAETIFISNMCVASIESAARTHMSFADNINNTLVQYLSPENKICGGDECSMARKRKFAIRDRNKLNSDRCVYI